MRLKFRQEGRAIEDRTNLTTNKGREIEEDVKKKKERKVEMSYAPQMQRPSTTSQSSASAAAAEQWQQAHYMGGADSGINTAAPGSLTGHEGGPEGYDYVAGQGYTQQQVDGE